MYKEGLLEMSSPIGYIVWWDFTKAVLSKSDFASLRETVGLPANSVKYLTKREAFLRAARYFKLSISSETDYFIDKIQKIHKSRLKVGVLERTIRQKKSKVKQVLTIYYSFGELECKRPKHELFQRFKDVYKRTLTTLSNKDLTIIASSALISGGALLLHPKGRIYFVPEDAKDSLKKIELFVSKMTGEAHLWAVPQYFNENLSSAIRASLLRYLVQRYRHFDTFDSKNYTSRSIILRHYDYVVRGRNILEYYVKKYGIDLREDLKRYDDRINKFKNNLE
jgi:hypothetical protein